MKRYFFVVDVSGILFRIVPLSYRVSGTLPCNIGDSVKEEKKSKGEMEYRTQVFNGSSKHLLYFGGMGCPILKHFSKYA